MKLKDVKQLYGRDIEIVREGLDEVQVAEFVSELVSERDMLLRRQEHLASLMMLAERTIAEADSLAESIRKKAEEEGRAKASSILAQAEKEAQQLVEQKRAEILDEASKEAEVIKDLAQQEAERLLSQQQQRIQDEIKVMVQKLHGQLMSGLKQVTEQAAALQLEWESRLSGPAAQELPSEDVPVPSVKVVEEHGEELLSSEKAVEELGGEMSSPVVRKDSECELDVLEQVEQVLVDDDAASKQEGSAPNNPTDTAREPNMETMARTVVGLDEKAASVAYEGTVELDILAPIVPSQLVEIQRYLRDWPGVGITELKPGDKGYSITLALDKPIPLIEVLRQLPEVEDARNSDNVSSKGGVKRIAITARKKK